MNPVGQYTCTRGISHALTVLIEDNDNAHKEDEHRSKVGAVVGSYDEGREVNAEAEGEVGQSAAEQARCHHQTALYTVDDIAVDEARCAVNQRAGKQYPAEALVGYAIFCRKPGHGQ